MGNLCATELGYTMSDIGAMLGGKGKGSCRVVSLIVGCRFS